MRNLCSLTALGLALALPVKASVLSSAAAAMGPGEWRRLSTTGYGQSLLDACDGAHSIFEWSNKAVWNEASDQFLYVGQGHYSCMKFINYQASSNSWRTLSNPPSGQQVNHSYDVNCTDGQNLFYIYYGKKTIYRYNIAGNSWSTLTTAPDSIYTYAQPAVAMDYFPELNGIVLVSGQSNPVGLYVPSTGKWEKLAPASNDYGSYSVMAQYNAVKKVLVYGGPGAVYRIDTNKTVTKLPTAPALLRVDDAVKFTHDPVSGQYLLFSRNEFYTLDAMSGAWTYRPLGADSLFDNMRSWGVVTPIKPYGVIMFALWNFNASSVWLYKHDPNYVPDYALASINASPSQYTIVAGGSLQFSAQGKDQYGKDFFETFSWALNGGGTLSNALFQSDGTPGLFTVTATAQSNAAIKTSGSVKVLGSDSALLTLVNFGATASANQYGISGWSTSATDVYTTYVADGPGGTRMTTGGLGDYNYQSVSGAPRVFPAGEVVLVTWYNKADSATSFTPIVSFTDPDRPVSGQPGTWYPMGKVSIPARSISQSRLALTGLAGTYSLVNLSHKHPEGGHLLCDKIELISPGGSTGVVAASPRETSGTGLAIYPNPLRRNALVSLKNPGSASRVLLRVIAPTGQIISRGFFPASSIDKGIGLTFHGVAPGLYFVEARSGSHRYMTKVVVEN